MALVLRGAGHRVRAGAGAGLAGVGLRAGVAVVARACRRPWPGSSRCRSPGCSARRVALVLRGAGHRVRAGAGAGLAGVGLRAGVAVVAAVPFGLAGFEQTPVAGLHVPAAWHWSGAVQVTGLRAGAGAGLAGVGLRAGVAVVARGAVRPWPGSSRRPSPGCTCPAVVALVRAAQVTGFAPVHAPAWQVSRLRAGVAVVAGGAVRPWPGSSRRPSPVSHDARDVALVGRGAGHRVRARCTRRSGRCRSACRRCRRCTRCRWPWPGSSRGPWRGLHVPATWHWSWRGAGDRVARRCRCRPGRCRSACTALPSLHAVPLDWVAQKPSSPEASTAASTPTLVRSGMAPSGSRRSGTANPASPGRASPRRSGHPAAT